MVIFKAFDTDLSNDVSDQHIVPMHRTEAGWERRKFL